MLRVNRNVLISIKYILVSGASKGLNYLLLLYFAISAYSDRYITILLLLSLEQILSLLLPLNHSTLIYSKEITDYKLMANKMTTNSILVVLFFFFISFIFEEQISNYFQTQNLIVFFSLFSSMLINSYLFFLTNYYKMIEQHENALKVQAFFLISFLTIILFTIFLKDIVLAFFLGKAIGLVIIILILRRLNLLGFNFGIKFLSKNDLKAVFNLFSVSALGWLSGWGILNFSKLYSPQDELLKVGYILNLFNVFLLLSIGINSIYAPLIKKELSIKNYKISKKIKLKTLFIYLIIAFTVYLFYLVLIKIDFNFNDKTNSIISTIPYVILLMIFNALNWVIQPFYLINNKFKTYNIINILSFSIWVLIVVISMYFGYKNFIFFLLLIHFIKSVLAFAYAEKFYLNR
ncbi:hypothetical protein V8G61_13590 [Gaetbulibacter sp. M240]|uniref:hypothetical protein n=1 Tax=Gaetbulibacter sp. M240 TaxID=3126511 RepID=UPI00374F1DD9